MISNLQKVSIMIFFFKFPANKIVVKTEMSLDFQNHLGKQ